MVKTSKKILIIEDEKAISKALDLKLTYEGFSVKTVFNGIEALSLLEKEKFDLILLDLVMPKLDGFGVLEVLKSKGNKIPIIVSSNLSQKEDYQRAKDLGAIDFLIKSDTPVAEVVKKIKIIFKI